MTADELCVVDASALAAVLFGEAQAERVEAEVGSASVLAAPSHLRFEIANVAVKKLAQDPRDRDLILDRVGRFQDMDVLEVQASVTDLVSVAEKTGLSAYDAAYLHAAIVLDVPLITLDKKLAAAARRILKKKD